MVTEVTTCSNASQRLSVDLMFYGRENGVWSFCGRFMPCTDLLIIELCPLHLQPGVRASGQYCSQILKPLTKKKKKITLFSLYGQVVSVTLTSVDSSVTHFVPEGTGQPGHSLILSPLFFTDNSEWSSSIEYCWSHHYLKSACHWGAWTLCLCTVFCDV